MAALTGIRSGYVRENHHQPRQVCEGLRRLGYTLWWEPSLDATLAALIRWESRRDWDAGNRALGLEAPHHAGGPVRALPSDRHRRNG